MANEELVASSFKKITNTHYECLHCAAHIKSSGLVRRCAHLAGIRGYAAKPCTDPNGELQPVVISAAKDIINCGLNAKKRKAAAQQVRQDHDAQQHQVRKQTKLIDSMAKGAAARADEAWGECFFECNIPFRVADNPRFKNAVKHSIAAGSGYNPPGRKKVAEKLLSNCFSKYEMKSVSAFDDVETYGYTSGEDGWTDNNRVPITAQTVSGKVRTHLLDIKHVLEPTTKDHEYLLQGMEEARQKIHKLLQDNNVLKEELGKIVLEVQKLTDDDANCKKAREEYGKLHPEVTVGHCTFHGVNLAYQVSGFP